MKFENFIYAISILALLSFAGYFFLSNGDSINANAGNGVVSAQGNEVQKITLSIRNYNYYPNTIKVKEGIPVEITLDKSIVGCYRAFTIRDFGVNVYSKTPDDKIRFTPNKKGTFGFSCTMGMGRGTLIVE